MIYSGSIVYVEPAEIDAALEILKRYENVEVHGMSEDKKQVIVAIESEGDMELEALCRELKEYDEIVDVAHHIFHFEDEVEEILAGNKVPSLDGFSKSSRKREAE